mgnify:CR=1 FL=1
MYLRNKNGNKSVYVNTKGKGFYFSSDNFNGLMKEEYNFKSSLGHDLKGFIYYYLHNQTSFM